VKIISAFSILCLIFGFSTIASAVDVESASEAQIAKIKIGLGDQYPVSKVLAVKSTTHKKAYYVGAAFQAEGVGTVTGVWLMSGTKDQPGLMLSVDGVAYEFSRMGRASESKAGGSVADPEAQKLKRALSN
jgi:hypothetical protein